MLVLGLVNRFKQWIELHFSRKFMKKSKKNYEFYVMGMLHTFFT